MELTPRSGGENVGTGIRVTWVIQHVTETFVFQSITHDVLLAAFRFVSNNEVFDRRWFRRTMVHQSRPSQNRKNSNTRQQSRTKLLELQNALIQHSPTANFPQESTSFTGDTWNELEEEHQTIVDESSTGKEQKGCCPTATAKRPQSSFQTLSDF